MCKSQKEDQKFLWFWELKDDYLRACEEKNFADMRNCYEELYRYREDYYLLSEEEKDKKDSKASKHIFFFTELLEDYSIILPDELSSKFNKRCYCLLYDQWFEIRFNVDDDQNSEMDLQESCIEFEKSVLHKRLTFSPLTIEYLKIKPTDIIGIECVYDDSIENLFICHEKDHRFF